MGLRFNSATGAATTRNRSKLPSVIRKSLPFSKILSCKRFCKTCKKTRELCKNTSKIRQLRATSKSWLQLACFRHVKKWIEMTFAFKKKHPNVFQTSFKKKA